MADGQRRARRRSDGQRWFTVREHSRWANDATLWVKNVGNGNTGWEKAGTTGGFYKGDNGDVGSGLGDIFRVNYQELTADVTIDADENASCAGPLTVDYGRNSNSQPLAEIW